MAKKYTTTRRATGFLAKVCTQAGIPTGHKVLVPYNSPQRFSIGSLWFTVRNSSLAFAEGEIPASWFIDLNATEEVTA
jgi:hypothetical protein